MKVRYTLKFMAAKITINELNNIDAMIEGAAAAIYVVSRT
jgi:hypothetical protein